MHHRPKMQDAEIPAAVSTRSKTDVGGFPILHRSKIPSNGRDEIRGVRPLALGSLE